MGSDDRVPAGGFTVFVVDDHEMVRMAFANYVEGHPGFRLIGQGAGDRRTLEEIDRLAPDVVTVDLEMPGISGSQFLAFLRELRRTPKILVCSMHETPAHVVDAFRRGADGYVLKRSPIATFFTALGAVADGSGFIDPGLHVDFIRRIRDPDIAEQLTVDEIAVLRLAADGFTNEQMADHLGQTLEAVKHRLKRCFQKLGARDRSHAVALAFRRNIL